MAAAGAPKIYRFTFNRDVQSGEVEEALQVSQADSKIANNTSPLLSAYPAPEEQLNLKAITTLAQAFGCPVGWSDSTLGITAPAAAVALRCNSH